MRTHEPIRRQPLFRLLGLNALAGATAAVVVTGLVLLDVGGFGRLMAGDEAPLPAFFLVLFGFVITLASAAMGVAVMRLGAAPGAPSDLTESSGRQEIAPVSTSLSRLSSTGSFNSVGECSKSDRRRRRFPGDTG